MRAVTRQERRIVAATRIVARLAEVVALMALVLLFVVAVNKVPWLVVGGLLAVLALVWRVPFARRR